MKKILHTTTILILTATITTISLPGVMASSRTSSSQQYGISEVTQSGYTVQVSNKGNEKKSQKDNKKGKKTQSDKKNAITRPSANINTISGATLPPGSSYQTITGTLNGMNIIPERFIPRNTAREEKAILVDISTLTGVQIGNTPIIGSTGTIVIPAKPHTPKR